MIAASMQKLLALRDTNINWRTAMMALILAIIILTDPFIFSGDFCGQLQKYQLTGTDLNYIHAYELSPDDYRVLYLPMTAPLKYNNSTYDGLDPVIGYSEKATLGNYQMDQFTQGLSLAVYNSSKDVQNLMNLLSIKYVFYRYNYTSTVSKYLGEGSLLYFDNKPYNISLSWTNTNLLKTINQSDLDLVNRTRDLLIYEDRSALPHVYAAAKARIIDGSISDMFETISSRNYNTDQSVIFLSKQTNGEQMQLLDDIQNASSGIIKENAYPSSLEYIKINPTKYMVRISNATQPFFLVFNEGYDPRWKAYVGDGNSHLKGSDVDNGSRFDLGDIAYLIDQKPLEDRNHLEANGYGNAWLIEPQSIAKDKDGNFIIILYFLPQSLYYTGLIVSALTAMVCVAYLVLTWSNWRRDGKHSRLGSMIRRCFCHGRQFTARLAYVGTEFSI
jgi:hypothetical protein